MYTEEKIIEQIYTNPGINNNELKNKLGIGMPSIVYAKNKIKNQIVEIRDKNQVRNYFNYKSKELEYTLTKVEINRIQRLPTIIQIALDELLKELDNKPIISLIFGSYARNDFTKDSDVDVLLVFNEFNIKAVEKMAQKISNRTNVNLQIISIKLQEFREIFHNSSKEFIKNIRLNKIILTGIRWWIELEQENTYVERMAK